MNLVENATVLELVLCAIAAYALGNVLGGPLVGRLRGLDLRAGGSGNVGATNALRTGGVALALPVLIIDVAKGVVAVLLLPPLIAGGDAPKTMAFIAGVAVAIGHCYPLTAGFRGGKGVATLAGVFAVLMPGLLLAMLAVFVGVVLATGYVSAASVAAAALSVAAVLLMPEAWPAPGSLVFVLAMAALVVFKHRDNLRRLWRGTESRFERAAVLRRWLTRPRS